jgi:hypothetical protein
MKKSSSNVVVPQNLISEVGSAPPLPTLLSAIGGVRNSQERSEVAIGDKIVIIERHPADNSIGLRVQGGKHAVFQVPLRLASNSTSAVAKLASETMSTVRSFLQSELGLSPQSMQV